MISMLCEVHLRQAGLDKVAHLTEVCAVKVLFVDATAIGQRKEALPEEVFVTTSW